MHKICTSLTVNYVEAETEINSNTKIYFATNVPVRIKQQISV